MAMAPNVQRCGDDPPVFLDAGANEPLGDRVKAGQGGQPSQCEQQREASDDVVRVPDWVEQIPESDVLREDDRSADDDEIGRA